MKSLLNNLGVQNYFSEKRLISVVFALLYFVICKLGFWWSAPYENASLFWPSLGFAVACVLTFGIYLLPYVFVGKFLALVSMAGWKFSFFFPTTLISCVDLIAVAFAVFLLKRVFRIDRKLESVGDILSLVTAGLLTSLFVTAPFSVIVFSLMDGEGQAYEVFKKSIWLHSLMGHAIGISLFGGTFLLWFSNSLKKLRVFKVIRSLGFAALFSCILGGVYFIFQDGKLLYLLLPPMMLSSFFMTPRQVSTLLALIAPLVIS
ncbi:MAG: MASE1 domain-containing protein, partial [Pseudobdellovibrionaceae bacterium]